MITIRDVARKANVSVATVSRVVNNKGYVHKETKALVQQIIKELNYSPNQLARSLSNKHSNIIGVIVPHIGTSFYSDLLEGIESVALASGYKVMLCSSQDSKEREDEYIQIFNSYNVDGLIIASNLLNPEKIQNLNIPIVTVDHILNEQIPSITADNISGGRVAAQKLIDAGCKNFVHFRGPSFLLTVIERSLGFTSELEKHGYKCEMHDFDLVEPDVRFIYEYLEKHPKIDGIFCGSDLLAISALQCLNKLGRKVPDDVQIVGFDNIIFSKFTSPSLTTIAQPVAHMGQQAFNTLVKLLHDEEPAEMHQILDVELKERQTTKNKVEY